MLWKKRRNKRRLRSTSTIKNENTTPRMLPMRLRKKKWKPTGVKKDRCDDPMVVAPEKEVLAQMLQEKH